MDPVDSSVRWEDCACQLECLGSHILLEADLVAGVSLDKSLVLSCDRRCVLFLRWISGCSVVALPRTSTQSMEYLRQEYTSPSRAAEAAVEVDCRYYLTSLDFGRVLRRVAVAMRMRISTGDKTGAKQSEEDQ